MKSDDKLVKKVKKGTKNKEEAVAKPSQKSALVLEGIRVLDFGRYMACPYGGLLLADMGAEVIRVEPPGGTEDRTIGAFAPTGESMPFGLISCRNKKDITLDIRKEEGQEILYKLIKLMDVVVQNFAPGAPESKILSYENLGKINPRIIVASITAFGKTGPYANRPGFDSIAQGLSSMMSWAGFPGSPPTRTPLAIVDCSTGLLTAYGVALCLLNREKTGLGQEIDVGLLDTIVAFVAVMGVAAEMKVLNYERPKIGNHSYYNFSDSFQTKDGWVMISAIGNRLWRRLVEAFGVTELLDDPRFKDDMSRYENRAILQPIFSKLAAKYTTSEFVNILDNARVPCGKINTIREMVNDPQIKAREMLIDVEYPGVGMVPLPGVIPKLSRTPGAVRKRASKLGEDNENIYTQYLKISREKLEQLKKEGVI